MVQYLFNNNFIMYSFAALCGLGLLMRTVVNLVYKHLVKESDRLGETKNKRLTFMKKKFTACYKLKIGVNNVDTFVDKNILSYRFCGILLSTWDNFCGQILYLMLLCVPIITVFGVASDCGQAKLLMTGAVGISTCALLIFVDKSINLSSKRKLIRVNLLDYLENFCKVRLEQEQSNPEFIEQYRREYFQSSGMNIDYDFVSKTDSKDPKDELSRRRQARVLKEEQKQLEAARREEEQRRAEEIRRAEEQRKLEEKKLLAARRREEELQKLEDEREALEVRRAELKKKAEEKQQASEQRQKKSKEKQQIDESIEEVLIASPTRTNMETYLEGVEEIAAAREEVMQASAANYTKSLNASSGKQLKSTSKTSKNISLNKQDEKLIEDVLKEFFA